MRIFLEEEEPHGIDGIGVSTYEPGPKVLVRDLIFESSGARIGARDYGGAGEAIVLLHGGGNTAAMWDGVASRLVNHFRVVALDLRSHGATEAAEPFSFEAIGRDIDAVIAELKLERAVVVGHSLGGCAAVEYATRPGCLAAVNIDGPVVEMGTLHDEIGEPFDWAKFEDEVSRDHFVGTGDELEKLLDRQLIEGQPL